MTATNDPAEYPCLLAAVMAAADHFRDEVCGELEAHGYGLDELEGRKLAQAVEDRAWGVLMCVQADREARREVERGA